MAVGSHVPTLSQTNQSHNNRDVWKHSNAHRQNDIFPRDHGQALRLPIGSLCTQFPFESCQSEGPGSLHNCLSKEVSAAVWTAPKLVFLPRLWNSGQVPKQIIVQHPRCTWLLPSLLKALCKPLPGISYQGSPMRDFELVDAIWTLPLTSPLRTLFAASTCVSTICSLFVF